MPPTRIRLPRSGALVPLLLAAAVLPTSARAASATLDPLPRDPASCVESGAEGSAFWLCRVWSGTPLPVRVSVLDDAGLAIDDGTAVQLFRRLTRLDATPFEPSGPPVATRGGRVDLRLRPPRSAWYAAEARTPVTPVATAALRVVVAARIAVPDDLGRQRGTRFTIRGRMAFAGSAARGTLSVSRCRFPDPRRCVADAAFRSPSSRLAVRRSGPFSLTVALRTAGTNVYRLRYVPRDRAAFVESSRLVAIRLVAGSARARSLPARVALGPLGA